MVEENPKRRTEKGKNNRLINVQERIGKNKSMTDSINRKYTVAYVGPKVFVCVCARAQVRSSLIFSHANEGVGAKITRPIFPPPQWGHYLLMFCIFPPSLPISRFLHPLPVARVFSPPSCYHFSVLSAIIKAQRVYNH